jgi:hypothetical protein
MGQTGLEVTSKTFNMLTAKNIFFTAVGIPVSFLVVAGGASGGCLGGGGGAGGITEQTLNAPLRSAISLIVGAGGAIATASVAPSNGSNSKFLMEMIGGGKGGYAPTGIAAGDGGSGGGTNRGSPIVIGNALNLLYGNNGGGNTGSVSPDNYNYMGGGGGGGSAAGSAAANTTAGAGGAGRSSSITGTATTYAGGGGGSGATSFRITTAGTGGAGGGGAGSNTGAGTAGTVNTGGGGGGGAYTSSYQNSGAGGSGIVVIKIQSIYSATFSAGVTATLDSSTVPGYKIYRVTATSTANETVTFS